MKKQTEFFLGYCGVTDDKIYFVVPVSKYVFHATHRDAVLCMCVCVGGGGGSVCAQIVLNILLQ